MPAFTSSRTMWSAIPRPGRGYTRLRGLGILSPNNLTPAKRRRSNVCRYDSSSDTEEDDDPEPDAKRSRCVQQEQSSFILVTLGPNCVEDVAAEEIVGGDLQRRVGSGSREDCSTEFSEENDECMIECARSSEASSDSEFDEYLGTSSPSDGFPWDDAEDAVQLSSVPDIKEYILELPSLLKRRVHDPTARNADEPLRVKLLAKLVKKRMRSGRLTESEILELVAQRPPYSTWVGLDIQTPEPEPEEHGTWGMDEHEFEEEDSSHPIRPATPMPPSDSDSDSESDDDGPPVYSNNAISRHLSRREMEMMGIYPDE